MDDLISRQSAIDALNEYFARIGKLKRRGLTKGEKAISLDTVGTIKTLPSIQPEIIRCGECKHNNDCNIQYAAQGGELFYCGAAERQEEE